MEPKEREETKKFPQAAKISCYATQAENELIEQAAAAERRSKANFVLCAAVERAERIVLAPLRETLARVDADKAFAKELQMARARAGEERDGIEGARGLALMNKFVASGAAGMEPIPMGHLSNRAHGGAGTIIASYPKAPLLRDILKNHPEMRETHPSLAAQIESLPVEGEVPPAVFPIVFKEPDGGEPPVVATTQTDLVSGTDDPVPTPAAKKLVATEQERAELVKFYLNEAEMGTFDATREEVERRAVRNPKGVRVSPHPMLPDAEWLEASFEYFWKEYPNKDGKISAKRLWIEGLSRPHREAIRPNKYLFSLIYPAIGRHRVFNPKWRGDGRFIKKAVNWLDDQDWEMMFADEGLQATRKSEEQEEREERERARIAAEEESRVLVRPGSQMEKFLDAVDDDIVHDLMHTIDVAEHDYAYNILRQRLNNPGKEYPWGRTRFAAARALALTKKIPMPPPPPTSPETEAWEDLRAEFPELTRPPKPIEAVFNMQFRRDIYLSDLKAIGHEGWWGKWDAMEWSEEALRLASGGPGAQN